MKAFIFFFSSLLLFGCKSSEIVKFKPYRPKDYTTKELEIYLVNERLYPILDSVILKSEECPMYQVLKKR